MINNDHLGEKYKKYAAPGAYPPIKIQRSNPRYAELLMDDYAGIVSEFTAISQYIYHHFFFEFIDENLAKMLEGIAIVEMFHMEILAELIILLGGDPKLKGSESTNGDYWNGTFVKYGNNYCEQLFYDVEAEVNAIENYKKHMNLINDPYIQAILKRIIKDEEHHIVLFNKQRRKFNCIK